ncbi:MAG TPA: hypothetical protein VKR58_05770 [Aquella sp.]|nr:hypothetical protein [Aquella sp.]
MQIKTQGSTSQSIYVRILDSTSTTGGGKTGLVYNTASLTCYYVINNPGTAGASVSVSLATQTTTGAYSSGGFVEVDSTNCPGLYRFDPPNLSLASGVSVVFYFNGATGMVQTAEEVLLTTFNLNTATQPVNVTQWNSSNVTAPNIAGTPIVDVGDWLGHAVTSATNGIPDTNTKNYNNQTAQTDGNNLPKVDIVDIAGNAVSATSAQLGVNVVNWNNNVVATPNLAGVPIVDRREWIRTNTAAAIAAGTITLDASASATNNYYNGHTVYILSATTGAGQSRLITGYVGSTQVATINSNWAVTPTGTVVFTILPEGMVDVETWLQTDVTAATAGIPDVNTKNWANTAVVLDANNFPKVDIQDILGATAVSTNSGYLDVNVKYILGTLAVSTNAGYFDTNVKYILGITSAGAAGYFGIDWANVLNKTSTVALTNTTISSTQTITSVSGSVGSVTGAVGSVTGNVGGNVTGSVGSILNITFPTNFNLLSIDASGYVSLTASQSPLIRTGTAQAGSANTITLDAGASATNNFYIGSTVRVRSNTGALQGERTITGYVGATKIATIDWNWITNPDSTSVFDIWYADNAALTSSLIMGANVTQWNGNSVFSTVNGYPDINIVYVKGAGSTGAAGFMGLDWSALTSQGHAQALTSTTIQNTINPVTIGTNNDKTGYALTSGEHTNIAGDVLNATASAYNTAGTIGHDINTAASGSSGIVQGYAAGEDPATIVLGATASSWNTAGTIGHDINAAGGAADPWSTSVTGDEVSGTFGGLVANLPYTVAELLAGKSIYVSNPIGNGFNFAVEMGYAYSTTYLNAPVWALKGYPDITGEAITIVNKDTGATIATCTILVSGASITQTVALNLTTAQTLALTMGIYTYNLVATVGSDKVILSTGQLNIIGPH